MCHGVSLTEKCSLRFHLGRIRMRLIKKTQLSKFAKSLFTSVYISLSQTLNPQIASSHDQSLLVCTAERNAVNRNWMSGVELTTFLKNKFTAVVLQSTIAANREKKRTKIDIQALHCKLHNSTTVRNHGNSWQKTNPARKLMFCSAVFL